MRKKVWFKILGGMLYLRLYDHEFNGGLYAYSHLHSLETQLEHNKGRYLAAKNADLYLNEAVFTRRSGNSSRGVFSTQPRTHKQRPRTQTRAHTWVSTPAISEMEDCHDI